MNEELVKIYIEKLKFNLNNITNQYVLLEAQYELTNSHLEAANKKIALLESKASKTSKKDE